MHPALFPMEVNALKPPTLTSVENNKCHFLRHAAREQKKVKIPSEFVKIIYPNYTGVNVDEYQTVIEYYQEIAAWKDLFNYFHQGSRIPLTFDYIFILGFILFSVLIFLFKKHKKFISDIKIKENNKEEIPKTKICPYCSEEILYTAKVCKHCRKSLDVFMFTKNLKFNSYVNYFLLSLIILSGLSLAAFYFYPITTYIVFLLKSCCDWLVTTLAILIANIFSKNKYLILKIINIILIIVISFACIDAYTHDIANMYSVPKNIAMLTFSTLVLSYLFFRIRKKMKSKFGPWLLWIIVMIISTICFPVLDSLYKPIEPAEQPLVNIEIKEYPEKKIDFSLSWSKVEYKDFKWQFTLDSPSSYDDAVRNFRDVWDNPRYTLEQKEFIRNHDMTNSDNIDAYNIKFNGSEGYDLPYYLSFGHELWYTSPEYLTFSGGIGSSKISASYNFISSCALTNCTGLYFDFLRADDDGSVNIVFHQKYPCGNNGLLEVSYGPNGGKDKLVQIKGKDIIILLLYSEFDKKIIEGIIKR